MDSPDLDPLAHRHALNALGRANAVSRTSAVLWPSIKRLAAASPTRQVRVLELACGGGHVSTSIAHRAARAGIRAEVLACDRSPVALDSARAHSRRAGVSTVRFLELDVLRDPLPAGFDVVLCSLFLHHLSDEEAVLLLRRMADAARRLVLVSDLRRSPLGYLFTVVGCRLLSRSPVFHVDGVRSVRAAFTADEARALAARAELQNVVVTNHWPQRFLMMWQPGARFGGAR